MSLISQLIKNTF